MGRRFPKWASENSLKGVTGVSENSQFENVMCTVLVLRNPNTREHVKDFEMPEAYTCLIFLVQHFPNVPEQGAFVGCVLVNEKTLVQVMCFYSRDAEHWLAQSVQRPRVWPTPLQDLCKKAKRRGVGCVL